MKLALICRPFVFHGGVETATAGLMGELVRRGYAVDLYTTAGQAPVPGVTIRRLPVIPGPRLVRLLSLALSARRVARSRSYDVVQSHERSLGQDLYRAGEGTHRGYLEAVGRPRPGPYHRCVIMLERKIFTLETARAVVAISEHGRSEIRRLYGTAADRVTRVYNGVDLARFHPANRERERLATRSALGLATDAWVVVFVGSGFERKGLGPLIEGLARTRDARSRLVVAGRGSVDTHRALATRLGMGERVLWTAPRPDVERLYAAADVVALPARYEPFGNVHLEALASGVPVLSSRAAGGAELIEPGRNGWVVDEVSAEAIASGLDRLHESDRASLSAAARASAEPFTYAAQVDRLEQIYRTLAR